jgi:thioredoxin 1
MKKLTGKRFKQEVVENNEPVMVEFFTEWSGSAFLIAELLSELEKEYGTHVKFVLVNIDESPEISSRYGVKKIPTILFFRKGEVINQLEGTPSRATIKEVLNNIIKQIKNEQK